MRIFRSVRPTFGLGDLFVGIKWESAYNRLRLQPFPFIGLEIEFRGFWEI